jgi:hypothetical protein
MLYALDDFYPDKQKISIDILADHPSFAHKMLANSPMFAFVAGSFQKPGWPIL